MISKQFFDVDYLQRVLIEKSESSGFFLHEIDVKDENNDILLYISSNKRDYKGEKEINHLS